MVSTVWVIVTPLVGVVIGGGLSLASQRFTEQAASRRQVATILEGRRRERLTHLITFIQAAQEVERVAIGLHHHQASDDAFMERTEAALDQLWVTLRAVQMLCTTKVSQAARTLAGECHRAVREGPGDQTVTAFLRPSRGNLIAVAHEDLDRV
jgi:hypothetical protein